MTVNILNLYLLILIFLESEESRAEAVPSTAVSSTPPGPPTTIIIVVVVVLLVVLILVAVAIILILKFVPKRGKKGLYSPDHYHTESIPATTNPYDSMELKYRDDNVERIDMTKEMEANLSSEVVPQEDPIPVSVAPVEGKYNYSVLKLIFFGIILVPLKF